MYSRVCVLVLGAARVMVHDPGDRVYFWVMKIVRMDFHLVERGMNSNINFKIGYPKE